MRQLIATCGLFACACLALAGGDRWWELYTPAEQQKLFVEYDAYLHPTKEGKTHPNYKKAVEMLRSVKGQESKLVTAAIAWGDQAAKESASARTCRIDLLGKIFHADRKAKGKVFASAPDKLIDEYFWLLKDRSDTDIALLAIGNFGPRAARLAEPIRDWYVKNPSGSGVNAEQIKAVIARIKK